MSWAICYELGDLLAVAFLTYLTKREEYADMALFARHQARDFGLFPYTDKSPSSDTFERLFAVLKTEFLEQRRFWNRARGYLTCLMKNR